MFFLVGKSSDFDSTEYLNESILKPFNLSPVVRVDLYPESLGGRERKIGQVPEEPLLRPQTKSLITVRSLQELTYFYIEVNKTF